MPSLRQIQIFKSNSLLNKGMQDFFSGFHVISFIFKHLVPSCTSFFPLDILPHPVETQLCLIIQLTFLAEAHCSCLVPIPHPPCGVSHISHTWQTPDNRELDVMVRNIGSFLSIYKHLELLLQYPRLDPQQRRPPSFTRVWGSQMAPNWTLGHHLTAANCLPFNWEWFLQGHT